MDEIKCPVCGSTLELPKPKSLYARCSACKLDYPRTLMADLEAGKLPPYFTLTENSISVINFSLIPCLLSTLVISLMTVFLIHRGLTMLTACIVIVGGLLMFDMFFKSFFRRYTISRKDGQVFFSSGIGKFTVDQKFPEKQIKEIAIHLRKDRSVNHPVLVIDFYDNRRMLFGDGCPAFYIAVFYFWLKGRKLSIREEEKNKA